MRQDLVRHYVVLKPTEAAVKAYFQDDEATARQELRQYIAGKLGRSFAEGPLFDVAARPSREVRLDEPCRTQKPIEGPVGEELVAVLHIAASAVERLMAAVSDPRNREVFSGSSPDIPFAASDHWCPHEGADSVFANRSAAERLLGVDFLRRQDNTTGKGVNVVVVDQGLDKQVLGDRYGGGWSVGGTQPGATKPQPGTLRRSHGMMIAHNILKVAPEATLFDLPLAVKISDIQDFLSLADSAYRRILADIAAWRTGPRPGPWILVNPWGISDRKSEYPKGHYTENRNNPFNLLVESAVGQAIDVVFAAGNCGQFCPNDRCGPMDQGPGHSIWGANSLDAVLTVGAVRADATWLGYSSQGPGQPDLGANKPDLCTPSNFCDDDDAFTTNTGTSAACALAGGVIAALRSKWHSNQVQPQVLKDILNGTAFKSDGPPSDASFSHRLGNGILNAKAAFNELSRRFP